MKVVRILMLLLTLSVILIGCGDSGNGKTTDTAGSTHDHIYCDETPYRAYFDTFDELLNYMNEVDESKYGCGYHYYTIGHSKSIGYTYSAESTTHEFITFCIEAYETFYSDGGIGFKTPNWDDCEYDYCVEIWIKDDSVEYSGDIVEYSLKRFGSKSNIKEKNIYRTFTAQNGLGDFYLAFVYDGLYYAYTEIDDNYYMSVYINCNHLPEDVIDSEAYLFDHETHMDALEEFVNSLTITKIPL